MKRFDNRGMMVVPNPVTEGAISDKALVAVELYCQNGHNLINPRANFNGYPGVVVEVEQDGERGTVALSPIFGEKSRIALDIELIKGKVLKIFCPECGIELPVHSTCPKCEQGQIVTFFLSKKGDFAHSIGICNTVDCPYATLIEGDELISIHMLEII